jgi:uncharacterized protein
MIKSTMAASGETTTPYHLLAKPAGAACNLGCHYCFFLSKENLYPRESHLMPDERLERYIRQLFESSAGPEVHVAWQGGEPMLRGLDFFKRSVQLAERHRKPHQVAVHTIQTNGTLIDDEWAAFFKRHDYLVGISLDGPRELHDAHRVTKNGRGSFDDVLRGWKTLRRHGVRTNILCTVHAGNADHPLEVYRFFRDQIGAEFIQLIPIVERATPETLEAANGGWGGLRGVDRPLYRQEGSLVTSRSVSAEQFGRFLIGIFDEWLARDIGKVFVTTFDVALGSWLGQHNLCIVAPRCGNALVLEHNGDVYSCDHYVEPGHLLGNVDRTPLRVLVESEKQRRFGDAKSETLPQYCRECPVLFACHGECPRNRFTETPDDEPGLNYLCAGYRAFFLHIDPHMKAMAKLVRQGRFADEYVPASAGH